MLVVERLQRIVSYVFERGSIRVTELSNLLQVTEETIRRDLDKLESEGKLIRSHGGAIRVLEAFPDIPFLVRESTNAQQKKIIAQEAIKHISIHDRIILDASTTAWYISRILPDMPLTVLTNSIKVAMELSTKPKIQVISTGGLLTASTLSFVGFVAEQSMEHFHVDKLFFSCKGLHIDKGISESSESQSMIKQKMISIAEQVYLLADYSKFVQQSFIHVCGWTSINTVITDSLTNQDTIQRMKERAIQVIQVVE